MALNDLTSSGVGPVVQTSDSILFHKRKGFSQSSHTDLVTQVVEKTRTWKRDYVIKKTVPSTCQGNWLYLESISLKALRSPTPSEVSNSLHFEGPLHP